MSERTPAVWIGEADVTDLIRLPDAISAVRHAYLRLASDQVVRMPKTLAGWDGGALHAVGAVATDTEIAVTKSWVHAGGSATPLLLAWSTTGNLLAVIEAFALGQLRTSAVTGVATDALARPDAKILGVLGAGHQASAQIAAVASVRPLRHIRVFAPTLDHATALARSVQEQCGIVTTAVTTAAAALDGADLVVTATRATEPIIASSMLSVGVHINAIGAITAERAELAPDVVRSAQRVVADDVAAARQLAPRELSPANAAHVLPLSYVLANGVGRSTDGGATIFKAVGSGVSDLAIAELVIDRTSEFGRARPIPLGSRRQPQIWSRS